MDPAERTEAPLVNRAVGQYGQAAAAARGDRRSALVEVRKYRRRRLRPVPRLADRGEVHAVAPGRHGSIRLKGEAVVRPGGYGRHAGKTRDS